MLLIGGNIIFGVNSFNWTFGDAKRAIDALVRINNKKIRTFTEAIHRTNLNTIGVFALNAGLSNNVGHEYAFKSDFGAGVIVKTGYYSNRNRKCGAVAFRAIRQSILQRRGASIEIFAFIPLDLRREPY
jgi:hypothetical protein